MPPKRLNIKSSSSAADSPSKETGNAKANMKVNHEDEAQGIDLTNLLTGISGVGISERPEKILCH